MLVNIKVTGGWNIESGQNDRKAGGGCNIDSGQNDPKATQGLSESGWFEKNVNQDTINPLLM